MKNVYKFESGVDYWVVADSLVDAMRRFVGVGDEEAEVEGIRITRLNDHDEIRVHETDVPIEGAVDGVKTYTAEDFAEAYPDGLLCSEF